MPLPFTPSTRDIDFSKKRPGGKYGRCPVCGDVGQVTLYPNDGSTQYVHVARMTRGAFVIKRHCMVEVLAKAEAAK